MAKSRRKKLIKDLDDICREIIIVRDDSFCQKCGKYVTGSDAHRSHIVPRSKGYGLRWDLINQILFCFHCHINWWHKSPLESGKWFMDNYPARGEYVEARKNKVVKWKDNKLELMLAELKQKLKELKNES